MDCLCIVTTKVRDGTGRLEGMLQQQRQQQQGEGGRAAGERVSLCGGAAGEKLLSRSFLCVCMLACCRLPTLSPLVSPDWTQGVDSIHPSPLPVCRHAAAEVGSNSGQRARARFPPRPSHPSAHASHAHHRWSLWARVARWGIVVTRKPSCNL